MAVRRSLDDKLRKWLKEQVRGQQLELGESLQKAGLVKNGQVWVSKYINGGGATATIDHLQAIATFFERSLGEMLVEAGGRDLVRHTWDQGSGAGGSDVPASREGASVSGIRRKNDEVERLKARLSAIEDVAGELLALAVGEEIPAARRRTTAHRGRRRTAH